MPISALPTAPSRASSPSTFSADADAFVAALALFRTEANATAVDVDTDATAAASSAGAASASATNSATSATASANSATAAASSATAASNSATASAASAATAASAPGTSATSTTSLTIGATSKALTIQAGKSLVVGMTVKIADTVTPTNWMAGDITAYDSGTGALTVNVTRTNGSGTVAAWTVSLSGPIGAAGSAGDHVVEVSTGNGHGSTNTCIRRYTTTLRNVGSDIVYADSATLGASFTIAAGGDGLYEIYMVDTHSVATHHGASLNSAQGSTVLASITAANRLMLTGSSASVAAAVSMVVRLAAGDVVRPHTQGLTTNTTIWSSGFAIRKVGV